VIGLNVQAVSDLRGAFSSVFRRANQSPPDRSCIIRAKREASVHFLTCLLGGLTYPLGVFAESHPSIRSAKRLKAPCYPRLLHELPVAKNRWFLCLECFLCPNTAL
jgi:hypothetical protein